MPNIDGSAIINLRFSDGVDALVGERQELKALVKSLDYSCTRYEISVEKTTYDDKQRQWHPEEDQGKKAEAGYSNKLQIP